MISQVKRTWRAHYGFWPINDCLYATWHARAPRDTPHLSIIHRNLAQSIYSCVIPRSRSGLHLERQLVSLVAFYQIESATRILSQIDVFVLRVYVFCRHQNGTFPILHRLKNHDSSIIHRHLAQSINLSVIPRFRSRLHKESNSLHS